MSADPLLGPEPLSPEHEVAGFECGKPSLDSYLIRQALQDERAHKTRTYVIARGRRVVGYFSLAAACVEPEQASERAAKGQGPQPVPAVLLGRLAVALGDQGQGFGEALLVEALTRAASAAGSIGARVVLVHAIDAEAAAFYARYGFEPSPTDPLHLMMLMKDVKRSLGR